MRGDSEYLTEVNGGKVSVFLTAPHYNVPTAQWQTWRKPRNASLLYIFALGSGGGGGHGCEEIDSAVNRGGGGGGGSAASCSLLIPAARVPDVLYVNVAPPGIGAGPDDGHNGNGGSLTYVSVERKQTAAAYLILRSGATAAGPGLISNSSAGGVCVNAGGIATATGAMGMGEGHWRAIAGQLGSDGADAGASPLNVDYAPGTICTGGAGGGSAVVGTGDTAGADINAFGRYPKVQGGAVLGGAGNSGFNLLFDARGQLLGDYFMTTGGAGGGGWGASPDKGGDAGDGGYGSGGGGGGAGGSSLNDIGNFFQHGGWGGSGLVIIVAR